MTGEHHCFGLFDAPFAALEASVILAFITFTSDADLGTLIANVFVDG